MPQVEPRVSLLLLGLWLHIRGLLGDLPTPRPCLGDDCRLEPTPSGRLDTILLDWLSLRSKRHQFGLVDLRLVLGIASSGGLLPRVPSGDSLLSEPVLGLN